MGRAILARLANAWMVPNGGVAVPVVFSRAQLDAAMGQAGGLGRTTTCSGLAADIGDHVQRNWPVAVYYDDQLVQQAGAYKVRHREADIEPGMVRLDLELTA